MKVDADARKEFFHLVNMGPRTLEKWLKSAESKSVGWSASGEGETVGHQSGRRIVRILDKKRSELGNPDVAHMQKVVGYIQRHLAQRPKGKIDDTRWRYSLMNWGHDPLKQRKP